MTRASNAEPSASRPLWLGVSLGFLLLALAWVAIFTAARHADTRTVPLQSAPARR
jgi:hypothetical protein